MCIDLLDGLLVGVLGGQLVGVIHSRFDDLCVHDSLAHRLDRLH